MKRFVLSIVLLSLAVAFGVLGCAMSSQVVAQESASDHSTPATTAIQDEDASPAVVNVGIYVLNVGKLDTSTGAFTIDFYLSLSSDQPSQPGNFEFSNGRATFIDRSVDEPTEKFYRIQASLASSLNLSRYPFDRHQLTIEIEDKEQTTRSQVYQVSLEDSGIDPAVNIAGWDLKGWKAEVTDHYYEPWGTTFSRYVFSIEIQRPVTAAILKTILPALVIVLVGLLSLVLTPDKIIPRLTLNTGAFTGAVLFHLNMTSSLPPLGYITYGDRFMLVNYFALALALVSTLVALYYVDKKQPAAGHVYKLALIIVPLVWVTLHGLNFILL